MAKKKRKKPDSPFWSPSKAPDIGKGFLDGINIHSTSKMMERLGKPLITGTAGGDAVDGKMLERMFKGEFWPEDDKSKFILKFDEKWSKAIDEKLLKELMEFDPTKHMGAVMTSPRRFGKSHEAMSMWIIYQELERRRKEALEKAAIAGGRDSMFPASGKGLLEQIGESSTYKSMPTAADFEKLISDVAGIPAHTGDPLPSYASGTVIPHGFTPSAGTGVEWKERRIGGPVEFFDSMGRKLILEPKKSELEEALEKRKAWEQNRPYDGRRKKSGMMEYEIEGKKYYADEATHRAMEEFHRKKEEEIFPAFSRKKSFVESEHEMSITKEILRAKRPMDVDEQDWNDYVDGKIDWFGNPIEKSDEIKKTVDDFFSKYPMHPKESSITPITPTKIEGKDYMIYTSRRGADEFRKAFEGFAGAHILPEREDLDVDGSAIHYIKTKGIAIKEGSFLDVGSKIHDIVLSHPMFKNEE